jgi:steroid 5-alpha reductase family enzyme
MNIIATAILLIVTLLVIPVFSYVFGTPLGANEVAALGVLCKILIVAWISCFLLGELTNNVSQVDKVWSLLPIVYAWTIAYHGEFTPRLLLMALLVTAWGARLTYNFSRHGAYRLKFWSGHEDYRWQVLREKPEFRSRWKWTLFNLGFISGYQNALILMMTLPMLVAMQFSNTPIGPLDYATAILVLFMLVYETIADNQQWRYQTAKHALIETGEPVPEFYARGFLDKGLWAYSRHPNYFAEQGFWICFYLFSVAASGQWINWSIAGSILLVILFRGSSTFSEEISAGKYPEYEAYQQTVPRFMPSLKRRGK